MESDRGSFFSRASRSNPEIVIQGKRLHVAAAPRPPELVRYSDNGSTLSAVNFPEASLPEHPGSRRLPHIHRNVPGMLSRINDVFSKENVNIEGEYLQTDSTIGYVVIDVAVEVERATSLKDALAAIPRTLHARVLY